jgi:hypothetical protein
LITGTGAPDLAIGGFTYPYSGSPNTYSAAIAPVLVLAETIAAETIAQAARGARLVILPSRDTTSDEALIGALLAKVRAPLMLIRAVNLSRPKFIVKGGLGVPHLRCRPRAGSVQLRIVDFDGHV